MSTEPGIGWVGIQVASVEDVKPLSDAAIVRVLELVRAEVQRQDDLARAGKFDGTHILPSGPDAARLAVLVEEVGEVAHEVNEAFGFTAGRDTAPLYGELVQVAASSVAWLAALSDEKAI